MSQGICLLGATGSIGTSTLDIIAQHPDRFHLVSAVAHSNVDKMAAICERFAPKCVVMTDADAAEQLAQRIAHLPVTVASSADDLDAIVSAPEVDQVMAAIMGFAGLRPTLAAIRAGKRILLANKESLVTAGKLFMAEVAKHEVLLLPIDSEHNAIYQSLPQSQQGAMLKDVDKLLLTASGGPFRTWSMAQMQDVTPEQACAHPNWSMGQKISVDSASLMNKGLELIEACWLFGVTPEQVDVVVHPQSIIHSMVSYNDGSVIAQMGNPDMRVPIAYGMTWSERVTTQVAPLNLFQIARLDFEAPDLTRFPNLRLASEAWYAGGTAMATLNAANEVAVAAFLQRQIGFLDIAKVNEKVLELSPVGQVNDLSVVFAADEQARTCAAEVIASRSYT